MKPLTSWPLLCGHLRHRQTRFGSPSLEPFSCLNWVVKYCLILQIYINLELGLIFGKKKNMSWSIFFIQFIIVVISDSWSTPCCSFFINIYTHTYMYIDKFWKLSFLLLLLIFHMILDFLIPKYWFPGEHLVIEDLKSFSWSKIVLTWNFLRLKCRIKCKFGAANMNVVNDQTNSAENFVFQVKWVMESRCRGWCWAMRQMMQSGDYSGKLSW